ncbi:Tat pathway signal sequence domain protein [Tessaracoccus rhinocerotis]|uniref:Tat pathway signal sequence domain protein n=1 Tax=Tessaracoccus rhinocerotis TaxID=1689449 RepID=A0A553JZ31_9ACTN|nr:Tat pathway signal sequence domain protein [Tessaracoccus rhinocerotis]TRY17710.1 Tat pathway signal sequence domain protein [Tessaracoccus rhinocerotis]
MTLSSQLRNRVVGAAAAAVLFAGSLVQPSAAAPPTCSSEGGALQVTADCVDPTYASPVVDSTTDETSPLPHRRIRGHFEGTDIQFTVYFHAEESKSAWEGRFFQFTYPTTFAPGEDLSQATDRAISFALGGGGYAVQAGNSSVSLGYAHGAAAAKFAKTLAADYYAQEGPIHGYLYGPSGGSFQTLGAAENTTGVWDGFVSMVQAVPQPTSYQFQARAAGDLILTDKAAQIQAAMLPGGSGDPFAGLDEAESAMLEEMHRLGVPWQAWEYPDYLLGQTEQYANGLTSSDPLRFDPTYADDFWNAPGYLGVEDSALGERVRSVLAEMGDTEENRWDIANRFYYRYQVPPEEEGWVAFDQFRGSDGTPIHPQRVAKDSGFHGFVSGNTAFDGSINGKFIAVSNLYDTDALPLHTDWYRRQVEASLGHAAADHYRVYFNDHADHQDAPVSGERAKHLVDWYGMVEQALRDIANWAEDGVEPPASTQYDVVNGQIVVPDGATDRLGIQPTVSLTGGGLERVQAKVGEPVALTATVQVPPGAGEIIRVEWDLDGDGDYEEAPPVPAGAWLAARTSFEATASFEEAGTHFVGVRVTAERNGDVEAQHAWVLNLDRVQIVVSGDTGEPGDTDPPVEPTPGNDLPMEPTPDADPSAQPIRPPVPGIPPGLPSTGADASPGEVG